jgi:hypothetical protein
MLWLVDDWMALASNPTILTKVIGRGMRMKTYINDKPLNVYNLMIFDIMCKTKILISLRQGDSGAPILTWTHIEGRLWLVKPARVAELKASG